MPIQTRQMFNPQTEAARYQLELAQALQQRAMTPNLPPMGGPVQAQYGMGQGLVDLANALASSWNVRRANQAYERAQEADKAKEEAKLRQQQEAQQASLMQMIGGQPGADGVGPPSPEPSYEQTIGMAQGAINAGVAPEIAKALIEARKPKAPERIDGGDRWILVDQYGRQVGEIPKNATPDAVMREQGDMARWGTPSANTQMTVGATMRGQDIGAQTARRGQDMTYASTTRGQDATRQTTATASAQKVAFDQAAAAKETQTAYAMYEQARNGMMAGLERSETGPIVGRMPAFTAAQQTAQGGVAAMAPVLKQLFRVAGEGVFTDRDQALLLEMVPDRTDRPEARRQKIENIDRIVQAKLGIQAPQMAGPSSPADDPFAEISGYMQQYGGR